MPQSAMSLPPFRSALGRWALLALLALLPFAHRLVQAATVFSEGFEGPGYENPGWIEIGPPNPDWSNSPLQGAQSLHCVGHQLIRRPFAYGDSFHLYLQVRWVNWVSFSSILDWEDAGFATMASLYGDNRRLMIRHGTTSPIFSLGPTVIETNTTYHCWLDWSRSTTGSNGTMALYLSTSGFKPAAPEAVITNGTATSPTYQYYIGPTSLGSDVFFDEVLVADATIGNNPNANHPPSITDLPDHTLLRDTVLGPVPFTVSDLETPGANLLVTASSSNTNVVAKSGLLLGGTGTNRTLTVTPAAGQVGTTTITLTVQDGTGTASDSFQLTVSSGANTAPTVSGLTDRSLVQDETLGPIPFVVGDNETPASALTVAGRSSNPGLLLDAGITLAGSGANRTLSATPLPGRTGITTVTVTVGDGQLFATNSFLVTVNSNGNTGPILLAEKFEGPGYEASGWTEIGGPDPDFTTGALQGSHSLRCTAGQFIRRPFKSGDAFHLYFRVRWSSYLNFSSLVDWDDAAFATTASIYAENRRLLLRHGSTNLVVVNGTTAIQTNTTYHCWLDWTRATAGNNGEMRLFLSTSGLKPATPEMVLTNGTGSATTERLYVGPTAAGTDVLFDDLIVSRDPIGDSTDVNHPPQISSIPAQTMAQDTVLGPLRFSVGDVEAPATALSVSARSSNPLLLPDTGLALSGSGSNRLIAVTPAPGQIGRSTVTLSVSDGIESTLLALLVTVTNTNPNNPHAPLLSEVADQSTDEDTLSAAIPFTVTDLESPSSELAVQVSSRDPILLPPQNLFLSGGGDRRTLTLLPGTNLFGSALVTLTVTDPGGASTTRSFLFQVHPVVDPVVLLEAPQSTQAPLGGSAVLSVNATSALPLNLQWRRNGQDLVGATDFLLVLTNLTAADEGAYTVYVGNEDTFLVTPEALVRIGDLPAAPHIISIRQQSGVVSITFSSSTGIVNRLEAAEFLINPTWNAVEALPATSTLSVLQDRNPGSSPRFYRVRSN